MVLSILDDLLQTLPGELADDTSAQKLIEGGVEPKKIFIAYTKGIPTATQLRAYRVGVTIDALLHVSDLGHEVSEYVWAKSVYIPDEYIWEAYERQCPLYPALEVHTAGGTLDEFLEGCAMGIDKYHYVNLRGKGVTHEMLVEVVESGVNPSMYYHLISGGRSHSEILNKHAQKKTA